MSHFSKPLSGRAHGNNMFSVINFDLNQIDDGGLPVMLFDDFRVSGRPFGPHPHAGFSAITYIFEDSNGSLRSRDSLGNDLVIEPGGIVWLQSGRGAQHEETPEEFGRQLHGAQIYVNLHAINKKLPPKTHWLIPSEVPRWEDEAGNSVRVLVGAFRNTASSLSPSEPFNILELAVKSTLEVALEVGAYTLVYARDAVSVEASGETLALAAGQLVAVKDTAAVTIAADTPARLLVLSGRRIDEPRHVEGPFILNRPEDMNDVVARYRRGEMGHLPARPQDVAKV